MNKALPFIIAGVLIIAAIALWLRNKKAQELKGQEPVGAPGYGGNGFPAEPDILGLEEFYAPPETCACEQDPIVLRAIGDYNAIKVTGVFDGFRLAKKLELRKLILGECGCVDL